MLYRIAADYSMLSKHHQKDVFTKFPELPAELRLKIWEHTFEPRKIHIYIGEPDLGDERPCLTINVRSDRNLPKAFSVCAESRELVLSR